MLPVLPTLITIAALLAAAWSLVPLIRDKPVGRALFAGLGVIEAGLLVQSVAGVVLLVGVDHPVDHITFVGYLVGELLVLPAAAWWANGERSRWGPGVLLVACLIIPVLVVRLHSIWSGYGA